MSGDDRNKAAVTTGSSRGNVLKETDFGNLILNNSPTKSGRCIVKAISSKFVFLFPKIAFLCVCVIPTNKF